MASQSKPIHLDSSIPAMAKLVYYTLHQVNNGHDVQISIERLANLAGICTRTVIRHTAILEEQSYLTVIRAPQNTRICNIYRLQSHTECFVDKEDSLGRESDSSSRPLEEDNKTILCDSLPTVTGMSSIIVFNLVAQHGQERVKAAIKYAEAQHNLYNKPGFIIRACQGKIKNLDLSELEREFMDPGLRYISGEYADFINH